MADTQAPEDFQTHIAGLLQRLDYAQAQAAADYDTERQGLADTHGKLDAEVSRLQAEKAKLDPVVEKLLATPGAPLDAATEAACVRYLEVCAELQQHLEARRMAFGATLPPGEQPPGEAIQ